jgi:hypothetical protein
LLEKMPGSVAKAQLFMGVSGANILNQHEEIAADKNGADATVRF